MKKFIPPKPHPLVLQTIKQVLLPLVMNRQHLRIAPQQNVVEKIRDLRSKPTVLMINHTDRFDPVSVAALSDLCDENFYFLASRGIFDDLFGIVGWILQHAGVYSVIRGTPIDQESRDATVSLIESGSGKLVMFPEGDVSGRDDHVYPMMNDGLENIFEAQRRLLLKGSSDSVSILPVSIYYESSGDVMRPLVETLFDLERDLGIEHVDVSIERRTFRVLDAMVSNLELTYGVEPIVEELEDRIVYLCQQIVFRLSDSCGYQLSDGKADDALHSLQGFLRRRLCSDIESGSAYSTRLRKSWLRTAEKAIPHLTRVQQLLILSRSLKQRSFTLEHAWRIIDRIELEVRGKARPKGHRIAKFCASEPIEVKEYWSLFEANREEALNRLNEDVRSSIESSLINARKLNLSVSRESSPAILVK